MQWTPFVCHNQKELCIGALLLSTVSFFSTASPLDIKKMCALASLWSTIFHKKVPAPPLTRPYRRQFKYLAHFLIAPRPLLYRLTHKLPCNSVSKHTVNLHLHPPCENILCVAHLLNSVKVSMFPPNSHFGYPWVTLSLDLGYTCPNCHVLMFLDKESNILAHFW